MESNIGISDMCIACGHYHVPADWRKDPRECTATECKCRPKKFVPRSFKRKF